MDEAFIRRNFRLVSNPDEVFKRANVFCVDAWGRITGVNASECKIDSTAGFDTLHGLEYLDLSLNEIEDAEPLAALPSLRAVDLAFNRIDRIDFALSLPRLRFLDARNNRIRDLPPVFADQPLPLQMEYEFQQFGIFLDGNPLEAALVEALHQGDESVTSYLKSLDGGGSSRRPRRQAATPAAPLAETAADTVPEPGLGRVRNADRLGAAADADMLVSVLMARDTSPPLAVGLFGAWGSGKSFFMALMQERVDELAALKRAGRSDAEPFCGEIRQVRFNAWHFVDTNLWASLAAALFDGLASSGEPDDATVLLGDLDRARETAAKAREEREGLERDVQSLEARVEGAGSVARSHVAAALDAVRGDADLRKELRAATALDGATKEQTEDIVIALGNLRGFSETCTTLVRLFRDELLHRHRRRSIAGLVALAVITAVAFLAGGLSVAGKLVVLLGTATALLMPAATGAVWALLLARRAREAREHPLRERRQRLAAAMEAEEKTNQAVLRQERELEALREKGVRLRQFVRNRALSSDYTRELGVISKMRRDLEELVSLLPSAEDVEPLAIAASVADRVPEVERIILYIDDLDRCPEDKVVEVLQAVHLLLAFKLFVVVVGVDSQWLRGSLTSHYGSLLEEPEDYLEKIFQIPFTVRPMSAEVYRDLIKELTAQKSNKKASDIPATEEGRRSSEGAAEAQVSAGAADEASPPDRGTEQKPIPPRPKGLVISDDEAMLLSQLGSLVPTPRAAKRLVNIYRMLRVSAAESEGVPFSPGEGNEYQAIIVLLAIVIGLPDLVSPIFREIEAAAEGEEIWTVTARVPEASEHLAHLHPHVSARSIGPYQRWAPRVARFSFRMIYTDG